MPKLSLFKPQFMGRTLANRQRRAAYTIQRAYRRKRYRNKGLYRKPRPGGQAMIVPLKCGYQYTVQGTGSTTNIPIDQEVGLQYMLNPGWYNRYHPIFEWVRINKVRIEVTSAVNIGQGPSVSGSSLYRLWSKKAGSIAEVPPGSINEWMNLQNAKKSTFNTKTNSVNYYFTPAFEAPGGATVAKRLMYKQWFENPSGPTGCIPHLGIIGHIVRADNATLASTETFNVNVTLYCQFKSLKQL